MFNMFNQSTRFSKTDKNIIICDGLLNILKAEDVPFEVKAYFSPNDNTFIGIIENNEEILHYRVGIQPVAIGFLFELNPILEEHVPKKLIKLNENNILELQESFNKEKELENQILEIKNQRSKIKEFNDNTDNLTTDDLLDLLSKANKEGDVGYAEEIKSRLSQKK